MIKYHVFCWNPFQVNCYLLYNDSGEGWLIDAGIDSDHDMVVLDENLRSLNIKLTRLILTHGHVDHVCGSGRIYAKYGIVPELHPEDHFLYQTAPQQGGMFGMKTGPMPEVKQLVAGDLMLGDELVRAVHLPGHSPGSLGFYLPESKTIFAGDVIFRQSIGRTDLPGGNYNQLINSIRYELMEKMEDDTAIFPGHGPETTIGAEKHSNPFL